MGASVVRVLVTGGAGFIGSTYVRSVIQRRYPAFEDAEIVVLDLLSYAGTLANLEAVMGSRGSGSYTATSGTRRWSPT